MSTLVNEKKMKYEQKQAGYEIIPHPEHHRLYHIKLDQAVISEFLKSTVDAIPQRLEYTPYARFEMANKMKQLLGEQFQQTIRDILQDRESGGFTIGVQGETSNPDDYVRFATAFSYLVGIANFDAMTNTFYARFTVKDTDTSDSYLRQAYRLFTLHTDGTFVDEPTDWLLMMKMIEQNAKGGESRLLHLDDWEELEKFSTHPYASFRVPYKAPASKNVQETIYRETFYWQNNKPCICFIDQFAYPETIDLAMYLKEMSDSMENSSATKAMPLPVGDLILLNNRFWLHGRAAFEKHPELHRELMRQRGLFFNT
ncbi:glutarate dioxygenase GlaH [Ammoniphilus sp. CFH 90114]|uniref:glutarate dioxygenase GlaH n=1 Tax=Ammoniphilus sp. CFH 90114 TaxID=2493665 RepID=UPI00100F5FF2|nr:glutarate dioxygenase GlaH [Ammoniphilus sp. CFH 90114]RXT08760.1 carbon starvation induced protein CsiD [Ammoniphilus sp. CFH 90114]